MKLNKDQIDILIKVFKLLSKFEIDKRDQDFVRVAIKFQII